MRVLGIVPARGGSRRIPRKNLRLLGGKPLVTWALEAALSAERLNRVVVSSDDPDVLAIARAVDPGIAVHRPAELASDRAPAIAYVKHALATVEACGDSKYEAVAIVQPTSPLTSPQDIDRTIELLERSAADTAVSVMRLDHAVHPVKLKTLDGDRLVPFLEEERGRMAEHELPPLYVRNCAVYATRRYVVESGEIIGADCRGYVMARERSIDINVPLDLEFAEFLLARRDRSPSGGV